MDPKTTDKMEEVDVLRRANWELRMQILAAEGEEFSRALIVKYGNQGEQMSVNLQTGEITRTPRIADSVTP